MYSSLKEIIVLTKLLHIDTIHNMHQIIVTCNQKHWRTLTEKVSDINISSAISVVHLNIYKGNAFSFLSWPEWFDTKLWGLARITQYSHIVLLGRCISYVFDPEDHKHVICCRTILALRYKQDHACQSMPSLKGPESINNFMTCLTYTMKSEISLSKKGEKNSYQWIIRHNLQ